MYRVMIVDDEPPAVNLIKTIIEMKCENYVITATANDGEEALEMLRDLPVDLIITDIQMPGMSGLELLKAVREICPDVMGMIVSGYQEFEYAKEAIHQGAVDYILKPIIPSELADILGRIEGELKHKYYTERNRLMHCMVNEEWVDRKLLRRFFQFEKYYGAIVRLNGLPKRFTERKSVEVFSDIDEWIISYGRDDHETLYLCPEEIVCGSDFVKMMEHHMGKEQPEAAYVTKLILKNSVPVDEIGKMVKNLYRILDSAIVFGRTQTLILESSEDSGQEPKVTDYEYLHELEDLASIPKYDALKKEIAGLLRKWGNERRPQLWMETRIRQIYYMLQRYDLGNSDYLECEFLMDEAFANAENMEQLILNILDTIFKEKEEYGLGMNRGPEEQFKAIKDYIRIHMAEPLSLQKVSMEMGVSQTNLSRLFRKYGDTTFSNYLTFLRMEKAKKLLQGGDKVFVKEVAGQVGYKDQFYFSRIFYAYTGVRPSEYKEE